VNCHAPLESQATVNRLPTKATLEGVNCAACHIHQGQIVASRFSIYTIPGIEYFLKDGHATGVDSSLRQAEFCASCHQFNFPAGHEPLHYSSTVMQDTYGEFREQTSDSLLSGLTASCQGCHFPAGSHSLPGPLQQDWMRRRIRIDFRQETETETGLAMVVARFRIPRIGHAFPTGDLFRTVRLAAYARGALVGKTMLQRVVRVMDRKLMADSRLEPRGGSLDQEVYFTVSSPPDRCTVTYHYQGAIEPALTGRLPPEELFFYLYDGPCG